MVALYALLFGATFLAHCSDVHTLQKQNPYMNYGNPDLAYLLLAIILVCFVGLRTSMNDTAAYIQEFNNLEPFSSIDWALGSHPFFIIYQSLAKKYISDSAYVYLFITSAFVVCSYLHFLKKYTIDFEYSVFLMISIGVYGFTAGAIKQTLATAIAFIATDRYLCGNKLIAIPLLAAAVLFHPFVIVFAAVPFLLNDIWNQRTLWIILATIAAGATFSTFIGEVLEVTEEIGKNYSADSFAAGTGTNLLRFSVYAVTPILSFIYRKNLRAENNRIFNLAINLSLIACCFSFLSLFGGSFALGRMARYFDLFQCLGLPYIVNCGMKRDGSGLGGIVEAISIGCFMVYYLYYYHSYVSAYGFRADYFGHISIFNMLASW